MSGGASVRAAALLRRSWRAGLPILALAAWPALPLDAQSPQRMTVSATGNALHATAPGFDFIAGEALERLKDGQSLRMELELAVLATPGGAVVTRSSQTFNLSYDLWEERFAIARLGTPTRSVSHLTQGDARRWCLEQLSVPVSAVDRAGRDTPFWIRLQYRVVDEDARPPEDEGPFTLVRLIDRLSRRRPPGELEGSTEAGPFRLSD